MASTGEEHGLFWNSENGDRTYDANSFEYWLKKFFTSGVFEGDLQVQATSGMTLKVGSGYANTDGKVKFWNAEFSIVLDAANSTYPRIDTIVITRDNVNRTITCEKVTGAYSVDAPQPTPPVRDSETWQLVIAQIYVPAGATGITQSNITDTRPDPDLCGYIAGTVTEMDFSQFAAQFEAYYNEFVAGHEADFDTWEAQQQAAYAAWYAEVVAQMQDDHEAFEDWFENLQNQLDTDQLTHLQAQIDDIYTMLPAGSHITVTTEETTLFSMDVTISDGTHTITSEFDNNGVAVFKTLPHVGNFLISSTDGNDIAKTTVNIPYFGRYAYEIAFWNAYVDIDGGEDLAGYEVTVTNSEDVEVDTITLDSNGQGVFNAKEPDYYTFSTTYGTRTVTAEVDVSEQMRYTAMLYAGWMKWAELGGVDPSLYEDIEALFSDEVAVRRLMTIHASADYLIDATTADITFLDDFVNNDNVMKWIGLRDYVCDGLTNIAGVEAEFMASDYWERYLKDHVPVMTSNTTPYGTASASTQYSSEFAAWKAFSPDGRWSTSTGQVTNQYVTYSFPTPICIKKIQMWNTSTSYVRRVNKFKIQYEAGGSWIDATDVLTNNADAESVYFAVDTFAYSRSWRIFIISNMGDTNEINISRLQFFGRSQNVSVPKMTSNTAPFGEVLVSSEHTDSYKGWKAFDSSESSQWESHQEIAGAYIGYDWKKAVVVEKFDYMGNYAQGYTDYSFKNFKLQGFDGSNWVDIQSYVYPSDKLGTKVRFTVDNLEPYFKHRLYCIDAHRSSGDVCATTVQFYGVDYTEREFATGSTMKYIYDHGIELEPVESYQSGSGGVLEKRDSELYFGGGTDSSGFKTVSKVELTSYDLVKWRNGSEYISDTNNYDNMVVSSTSPSGGVVAYSKLNNGIPDNNALNIASIDSEYYLRPCSYGSGRATISEWWLE